MSMLIQAYLLERYGPRLNAEQLAQALGYSVNTVYNKLAKGTLTVLSYLDDGKRWFDVRDVADYLDEVRAGTLASVGCSASGVAKSGARSPRQRAESQAHPQTVC